MFFVVFLSRSGKSSPLVSAWTVLCPQVKIMLAHDPEGKMGPKLAMPDNVIVHEPKEDPILEIQPTEEGY